MPRPSVLVEVRVNDDISDPTTITNLAGVSSSTPDPDDTNNTTSETTTANQSALNPTDLRHLEI